MAAHPAGKNSFRPRKRSTFIVRYDAIITVIVAFIVGIVLGMGLQWQLTQATLDSLSDSLPPCQTEDSEGCYWDADTMGNGLGSDVVSIPDVPRCTDAIADNGGVCYGEPI